MTLNQPTSSSIQKERLALARLTTEFDKAIDEIKVIQSKVASFYENEISALKAAISQLHLLLKEKEMEIKRLTNHIFDLEEENTNLQQETAEILEKYSQWRSNAQELDKFRKVFTS